MGTYIQALKNIIKMYTMAGFKVPTLPCEREYAPLINEIQREFNIIPNFRSAQEHVPEAERNNQVIRKESEQFFTAYLLKRYQV